MDTGSVSSVLLKIAQRTQPKKLAAFMRRFVDYVVLSLPALTCEGSQEKMDKVRLDPEGHGCHIPSPTGSEVADRTGMELQLVPIGQIDHVHGEAWP